tara:strand:- start:255 stop:500 length:246 start_codon:yes stop_codon:yes gene_type:complete
MWRSYECGLCKCETDDYLCVDCKRIQKIIELYSVENVKNTLERIYVRTDEPIYNRTNVEIKEKEKQMQLRSAKKPTVLEKK